MPLLFSAVFCKNRPLFNKNGYKKLGGMGQDMTTFRSISVYLFDRSIVSKNMFGYKVRWIHKNSELDTIIKLRYHVKFIADWSCRPFARASIFTDAALPSTSDTWETRTDAANTGLGYRFSEAARCKSLWIRKVTEYRVAHKDTHSTRAVDTESELKDVTE